jgi:glyoxylase-like metal-dependent hydrolase (beta-lactamase superfamily II)
VTEIAEGIYRIESDLGPRFMCQYLVAGRDCSVLVDTGLADTPATVIDPYLEGLGVDPAFVVTSHADNDHCGGNRAFRDAHPDATFMCHERDRRWVESNEALVRENYGWHAAYGFPPMPAGWPVSRVHDRARRDRPRSPH